MLQRWISNPKTPYVILTLIGLTCFGQVVFFQFVNLDDYTHIINNSFVNNPTYDNISKLWGSRFFELYIPLTYTFWGVAAFVSQFFTGEAGPAGLHPGIFHASNLIFHLINGCLLYKVILTLKSIRTKISDTDRWWAIGAATLFLVHPLQAEPVSWVSGMKDSFSTLFFLSALLCHFEVVKSLVRWKVGKRDSNWIFQSKSYWHNSKSWIGVFLMVLGLITKPSVVLLPALIIAIQFFILNFPGKKAFKWALPYIILAIPFGLVTMLIQKGSDLQFNAPIYLRPLVALDSLTQHLTKFVAPFGLAPHYGRTPQILIQDGDLFYSWIVPVALIGSLYFLRNKSHWARVSLVAVTLFTLSHLPTSGLIPFHYQDFSTTADRYNYIPIAMLAIAIGTLATAIKRPYVYGLSTILAVLACLGALQSSHWDNSERLFKHTIQINEKSWLGHYNLAQLCLTAGEIEKGKNHLKQSIEHKPDYLHGQIAWGTVMIIEKKFQDCYSYFLDLIESRGGIPKDSNMSHDGRLMFSLAFCQEQLGDKTSALNNYIRSTEIDWTNPDVQYHVARLQKDKGAYDLALKRIRKALQLVPNQPTFMKLQSEILARRNPSMKQ